MTRLPLRTIGDAPKATKDLLVAADVQCGHTMVERECANSWIAACANTVAAASADRPPDNRLRAEPLAIPAYRSIASLTISALFRRWSLMILASLFPSRRSSASIICSCSSAA